MFAKNEILLYTIRLHYVKLANCADIHICLGDYSTLSHAVRANALRCVIMLISKGADVDKSCNGFVPPLMHAVKYGSIEIVKLLVKKGARIDYKYEGDYISAKGMTATTYTEANNQIVIFNYLKIIGGKIE